MAIDDGGVMEPVWVSRIGELLEAKSQLERRDVTVDELADYVGVSRQTISTWKSYRGVKSIPAKYTAKLCDFFGVDEWNLWTLDTGRDREDSLGQLVGEATVTA